jgi:hypothetical protein
MLVRIISWLALVIFVGYKFNEVRESKNKDLIKLRKKQQSAIANSLSSGVKSQRQAEKEGVENVTINNKLDLETTGSGIKSINTVIEEKKASTSTPTNKKIESFRNRDIREHGGGTFRNHLVQDIPTREQEEADAVDENGRMSLDQRNKSGGLNHSELYHLPDGNRIEMSDNRDILDQRITSVNTDIHIINKRKMLHELDNFEFDREFLKLINVNAQDYVDRMLNYDTTDRLIETRPRGGRILDQGYMPGEMTEHRGINVVKASGFDNKAGNDDEVEAEDTEVADIGVFRRIVKESITTDQIKTFNTSVGRLLGSINKNGSLKIKGGYNVINPTDFIVVSKRIEYIMENRNNADEYLIRGEFVIYREGKNNGKHILVEILRDPSGLQQITELEVMGIVTEDKIYMQTPSNDLGQSGTRTSGPHSYGDNLVTYKYDKKYVITYNPRETEVSLMGDNEKFNLIRNRRRELELDRGLK